MEADFCFFVRLPVIVRLPAAQRREQAFQARRRRSEGASHLFRRELRRAACRPPPLRG